VREVEDTTRSHKGDVSVVCVRPRGERDHMIS